MSAPDQVRPPFETSSGKRERARSPRRPGPRCFAVVLALLFVVLAGSGCFTESFDEVTAPSLPPGWVATNAQGPDPAWTTVNTQSDSSPNSAWIDDPTAIADKRLDSPRILISTSAAQLTFRHTYGFYFDPCGATPAGGLACYYTGGVLEISIDGGDFQDIIAAGGSFASGGYDVAITDLYNGSNPLVGRSAWGGLSSGWGTAVVNLPAAAAGTGIVLRWRVGGGGHGGGSTGWYVDSIQICDGNPCGSVPTPAALAVDTGGNGILEPGETVDVAPSYNNSGGSALNISGSATNLTGPAGATYALVDASASYGTIQPGATVSCQASSDCYTISVSAPGSRPAPHWDAQLSEQLSNGTPVTWAIHIGESFLDTPTTNLFYRDIETIFHGNITGGCGGGNFCSGNPALRKQMAVFLLKGMLGANHVPPPATGIFTDVPASDPFAPWIEDLYSLGITGGCSTSPLEFCPDQTVLRKQMAVFMLKSEHGSDYVPPACTGIFTDAPCPGPFTDWIEELYNEHIAAGCGNGMYCPDNPNTRGQMATFLVKTFGFTLYFP